MLPLLLAAIALIAFTGAMPQPANDGATHPPNAKFRGMTFEQLNLQALEWRIATGLGEQIGLADSVKNVRFLPAVFGPAGEDGIYDVDARPGTAFVGSAFFVFGERYDDPAVPDDDPNDPILDFIFDTTYVVTRLDGVVIQEGMASDLDLYGPTQFDMPIFYSQPQPRGPGLNSVAAILGIGTGAIYHPMSAGEHILEESVVSLFFGTFTNTYNIHVSQH